MSRIGIRCPKCGNGKIYLYSDRPARIALVYCPKCDHTGKVATNEDADEAERQAIVNWNSQEAVSF